MNTFPELQSYYDKLNIEKSPDSVRGYTDSITRFINYFDIKSVGDIENITFNQLIGFQESLKSTLKFTSVNVHIMRIKAFWNNLLYREIIKNDCINKLRSLEETRADKLIKEDAIALTDEEVDGMINSCKDIQSRLMLTIMFNLGLRRAEVTNILISDIHDCRLLIRGKGAKKNTFALRPEICEMVNQFMNERKSNSEFLFYGKGTKQKIGGQSVFNRVVKAARDAGIPEERVAKIGAHTCRRTCGTRIAKKHGILMAQKVLRHSSIITTQKYIKMDDTDLDNVLLDPEL